jgi:3-(3-hydroxy-phenyl)propionate hydroxylase
VAAGWQDWGGYKIVLRYERAPDQDSQGAHHPVVIVGAGPVGLALAIDLAQRDIPVVVLDQDDRLAEGSRAICFAKRTLEIFDRLSCGAAMVAEGVSWHTGKVFHRDSMIYSFDLQPEAGHARPAFINMPQGRVEFHLLERARSLPGIALRWQHRVTGVTQTNERARLTVATPEGEYALTCRYLVAADGARSSVRALTGHVSTGKSFADRFLIADVRMHADFPAERWFWFDPPFHRGQSVLLHSQPDNVWRIDFQLGRDADPVAERAPERVIPRIEALLGKDTRFTLEWVSVYTFACVRMARFRDGCVLFAGDAAHGVSPFGARGANSGVQDADNLGWKIAAVLRGDAPDRLLDTYATEREAAADENILNATRSTDFISPKTPVSLLFRDAVLGLAKDFSFARRLVNSGRLSVPSVFVDSPLNTPDEDAFAGGVPPGAPAVDAPLPGGSWLLDELRDGFSLIAFGCEADVPVRVVELDPVRDALAAARYDARPGTVYLLRPDQHVCARWRRFDAARVRAAIARAMCLEQTP